MGIKTLRRLERNLDIIVADLGDIVGEGALGIAAIVVADATEEEFGFARFPEHDSNIVLLNMNGYFWSV